MPLNLLKVYPQLLEILHLKENEKRNSLLGIYKRDIEDNSDFKFRGKLIYPIKANGEIDMGRQFMHLTCKEVYGKGDDGKPLPQKRVFDRDRSERLHWINYHIHEKMPENIDVFTITERDQKKRVDVTKTYIYDKKAKYIIVLEHQRSDAYYLLTAYYLNEKYAEKQLLNKMKKCTR
ncbi:hypothetical protein [uncultured Dysgonomonas sp.]|uniref:Uncharacterized protein n=1 Tax=uncultured Dysgonomonas sp. TaxID=206096 RepID=A0A212K6K9_9BACT|nr:hypothetical protein [uncultured Dysgonomonas sp.]SBW07341.1 conserved hypothetical protein [uncultured Dysgonomonas sp.]